MQNELLCLIFLFHSQNLLSLSKHVHVHGREERDVEQHGHQDEEGEAEGDIDAVGEAHTQDAMLVGVHQALELTKQLARHASRVGDNEESISATQ